jgi:pimeloyl-ACP methyl ester carboxylesterase
VVRAGDIRLAYTVSGEPDAPPMVLLHALGERGADWAPVTGRFAERFQVFAFDLRGHGGSDWPGEYSFELMRDDVVAALDELGLSRVTLVGHSMGGAVAYLVTMHRSDLAGRLIVEDASPPFPRDRAIPDRPDGLLDFDWPVVPAIVAQVNAGDQAAWDGLTSITAPALLVAGGAASHVDQAKLADAASRIPRCDLVTVPAGHLVHAARPAEFVSAVLTWLDG